MLLSELVRTWEAVAAETSRRAKVARLAQALRRLSPEERVAGAGFLAGDPPTGRIGIGWALLSAATPPPSPEPSSLTVGDVDRALRFVATVTGPGSRGERVGALADLLGRATAAEQRFLHSLLMRDLRQGALEGLLAEAVAEAAGVAASAVRRAVMVHGELSEVAAAALEGGAAGLGRFAPKLFRPLQPMLAQTAAGLEEPLREMGRVAVEAKIDGARIQVHRSEEEVRVFTRTGRDITQAVPEVVAVARAAAPVRFILDGEAVALGPDGRPLPFQVTMSRFGRREAAGATLPLTPVLFDCLHLEGEDLLGRPAEARWEALAQAVPGSLVVPRLVTEALADLAAFYDGVLAAGHEGVLVKDPQAPYEAGRRGAAWMKVKPAHTLDLVVLAAEWGSGRRRGSLSNLHLGARDPESGGFVMLGKTFKGLTDEMLAWQTERLLALEVGRRGHVVMVRPELVVEVACDGVQASPRYPGGVTLRFARVKGYRPDKAPEAADTLGAVRRLQRL